MGEISSTASDSDDDSDRRLPISRHCQCRRTRHRDCRTAVVTITVTTAAPVTVTAAAPAPQVAPVTATARPGHAGHGGHVPRGPNAARGDTDSEGTPVPRGPPPESWRRCRPGHRPEPVEPYRPRSGRLGYGSLNLKTPFSKGSAFTNSSMAVWQSSDSDTDSAEVARKPASEPAPSKWPDKPYQRRSGRYGSLDTPFSTQAGKGSAFKNSMVAWAIAEPAVEHWHTMVQSGREGG